MEATMHMTASVALLGAQLLIPVSDQVPTFNVERSCKGAVAATAGMTDTQSFSACMAEESEARNQLGPIWQSFSAAHRTRCTAEASGQGLASYVELLVCLQLASGGNMQPTPLKGARKTK
jgi:hypothetical protein